MPTNANDYRFGRLTTASFVLTIPFWIGPMIIYSILRDGAEGIGPILKNFFLSEVPEAFSYSIGDPVRAALEAFKTFWVNDLSNRVAAALLLPFVPVIFILFTFGEAFAFIKSEWSSLIDVIKKLAISVFTGKEPNL